MLKIGSIKLDTNLFLAPLAGCADLSFRLICREHGAGFCFYEMVDSNSLVRSSGKNKDTLMTHAKDHPIAAQILGGDPETTLEAARILLAKVKPLFLDLNAACPAKKVLRKKAGAYLVREPRVLYAILSRLASSLDLPITVKMRIGYDRVDLAGLAAIAKNCEAAGAAALFVHGRTSKQLYCGQVNYEAIRAVKQRVSIPVIGSGDVLSPELAKKMFDATGCDGLLVARGAMGNPWIFERIAGYLKTGREQTGVGFEQKKRVLLRHLAYMEKYRQSRPTNKMGLMRKIALLYLRSFPGAPGIRARITPIKSYPELVEAVSGIKRRWNNGKRP
ncbi:MAG: tRNA dihydrouridine synthase DusB [Candidatus Margulisiibacteriota bacterium]